MRRLSLLLATTALIAIPEPAPAAPVVAAVGAAALGGLQIGGTLATGLTFGFSWTAAAVAGVGSLALGFVTQALTPKPKAAEAPSLPDISRDRTLAIRQPIVTGKLHVGRLRLSGAQTLVESTGANNGKLHLLITLSVQPLGRLDELWINDEQVPLDWEFGAGIGGNATGKYAGNVKAWFGRGTTDGDSALNAALTDALGATWTEDHKQDGCGKLYVQLDWNESLFGGGTPNVSCVARAADLHDPRDDSTGWTDNWALAVAYYLTLAQNLGGFGAAWAEIDDDALIAAANASDEMVAVADKSVTFTADAAADTLTLADGTARLRTGMRVRLTTTGTLPGGLATGTDYYVCETGTLVLGLSTTLANARARTIIALSDAGSGTHTITAKAEPRYTANGTIDTADDPETILGKLLSGGAGKLVRVQGKWEIKAGVWAAPTRAALTMDDMVQGFSVAWRREPREAFNGVKGTFVDPDSAWQPTDFPAVAVAAYLTEDQNIRAWRANAELPFTLSPSMAQRIARIELERNRRQVSTKWGCKLTALDIAAGDVVPLTYPRYGWSDKAFEVGSFKLTTIEAEGATAAMVELGLAEIDENVFAWNPADEIDLPPSPRTNLPSPGTVAPPTSLTLSSGSGELDSRIDGTIFSRLRLDWVSPADAFVTGGGLIEIQFKKSADAEWQPSEFARGDANFYRILDVADGVAYDVRIRSRNYLGAVSPDWVVKTGHVVQGKSEKPPRVIRARLSQGRIWGELESALPLDFAGFRVKYNRGADRNFATARAAHGDTVVALPWDVSPDLAGRVTFFVVGVDTSGNESASPAVIVVDLGDRAIANVIETVDFKAAGFPGTIAGGSVSGGDLVADDDGGLYLPNPNALYLPDGAADYLPVAYEELTYEFAYVPGPDAIPSTLTLDLDAAGEGIAIEFDPDDQAQYLPDGLGAYLPGSGGYLADGAGWRPWPGAVETARQLYRFRITAQASATRGRISACAIVMDVPDAEEEIADLTIPSGGVRLPLAKSYRSIRTVIGTFQDDGGTADKLLVLDKDAALGPLVQAFAGGSPVSALADFRIKGVKR